MNFVRLLFDKIVIKFLAAWSPYWEHLKEAWAQKDHPNLLFMFYEEMKAVSLKIMREFN